MLRLVPLTQWFYGKDIFIDFLSVLVLTVLLAYAVKYYRMNRSQKKYVYLISSFILLSFSFVAKLLSHFLIYYNDVQTKRIGIISLTYQTINHSSALVFWGLLFYRILSIFALYLFYLIYAGKTDVRDQSLIIYLLMMVAYLGHSEYYIYHLTVSVLLTIILVSLRKSYVQKKSVTTKHLLLGFLLLLISQLVFVFIFLNPFYYLAGEVLQLIGYLSILFGFIRVISHGRK